MALQITFSNAGGALETKRVSTEEEAAAELIKMVKEAGSLLDGDKITITEIED